MPGGYEIHYNRHYRVWQIWHNDLGFVGSYRDRAAAKNHVLKLVNA